MAPFDNRKAAFGAICFVIAGAAALYFLSVPKGSPAGLAKAFGGEDVITALRNATEVVAFHIGDETRGLTSQRADPLDYKIIDGPRTVDPIQINELKEALLDPDSYSWRGIADCAFDPGVRVSCHHASEVIDVFFCFNCDQLKVYRNRTVVGEKDFHTGRAKFVAFAKRLFPNDPIIQALSAQRKRGS